MTQGQSTVLNSFLEGFEPSVINIPGECCIFTTAEIVGMLSAMVELDINETAYFLADLGYSYLAAHNGDGLSGWILHDINPQPAED